MVAKVFSRWPSKLGGESAGIMKVSVPPRFGVSSANAGKLRDRMIASASGEPSTHFRLLRPGWSRLCVAPRLRPAGHDTDHGGIMTAEIAGLVDTEHGMISRRIFIEPEIYETELRRIFARCWLFLCHDSQIPQAGRFPDHLYGRGPGAGGARQRGTGGRVPQCLSPSRQPAVSCGRGQRGKLHLRLSWLDVRQ